MCQAYADFSCDLLATPQAPAAARQVVRGALCDTHTDAEMETCALLLVSELVSDAVEMGARTLAVRLECRTTDLGLTVLGHGVRGALGPEAAEDDLRRLRWLMVDTMSSAWGTTRERDASVVWCRVGPPPAPGPGPKDSGRPGRPEATLAGWKTPG